MTTIIQAVASWQYQFATNELPVPSLPVAGWLNGVSPFGNDTIYQYRVPPRTEWLPQTALWMKRVVTLPEGEEFWIRLEIENAVWVYWDGDLISDINPTNTDVDGPIKIFLKLTEAQSSPGAHELILFCMDEAADEGEGDAAYISAEVIQPAIITEVPEEPIHEEWLWLTDHQTSYDGSEYVMPLRRYPKRSFSGNIRFDDKAALQRHIAMMFKQSGERFYLPLFQYGVKLKAAATAGSDTISVNVLRSDFRTQKLAILIERSAYEVLEVESYDADSVTFTSNLVSSFSKRAMVYPLSEVYGMPQSITSRGTVDQVGTYQLKVSEYEPWAPFVSDLNTEELTIFDDLAVLEQIPFGPQFDSNHMSGITLEEFIGLPALFTPWAQGKTTFNLSFLCNRVFDINEWLWWIVFADYCQGQNGIFLLPTNRSDLTVVTPAVGGGSTVVVESHDYRTNYWGLDTFARIAIESDEGIHYATITAVAASGDNDQLTFAPALPAGAGWDDNQKISFLLKVRNGTDKISVDHYGMRSELSFPVRTVA